MSKTISFTEARDNLASYIDEAVESHEVIRIRRKTSGGIVQEVALVDADDLESLLEMVYLLRSPKNAERLLTALNRSLAQTSRVSKIENF